MFSTPPHFINTAHTPSICLVRNIILVSDALRPASVLDALRSLIHATAKKMIADVHPIATEIGIGNTVSELAMGCIQTKPIVASSQSPVEIP